MAINMGINMGTGTGQSTDVSGFLEHAGNHTRSGGVRPPDRSTVYGMMQMKKIFLLPIGLLSLLLVFGSPAQARDECQGERYPHGNYCEGSRWGWYGERTAITSRSEAKKALAEYFSSVPGVKIIIVKERRWFFKAEIRDKKDNLIDVVIIDKRSGRIRSIY